MTIATRLAAAAILLVPMPCLRAQIPPGHVVVATNNLGAGAVGLHVAHPRSTGAMTTIQGSNLAAWSALYAGPQCVVIHEQTGDLLVSETGTGSISLRRLRLQGLAVAQVTTIPLGNSVNYGGVYAIAQQDEHHVLVACAFLTHAAGSPMANDILQVDLRSGGLVRIHGWSSLFTVQGLAYDQVTSTIFFSQMYSTSSSVSTIQGSTVSQLAVTNQGAIRGIAFDVNGDLLCSSYNGHAVIRITRQGAVSYPFSHQGNYNGIAREAATGQLFLVEGNSRQLRRLDPVTGQLVTVGATVSGGALSGVTSLALAPDPIRYGAPSGDGPFQWSSGGPQGLPRAGNPWTVQVDWPLVPAVWSALALGGAPASPPWRVLNLDVFLDAGALWGWTAMTLEPAAARSTRTLFLPPSMSGISVFLQSVHVTNTGTFGATSGLHCHIL